MKVEKITTIRIKFDLDFYCDITPSAKHEGVYDFWLYREGWGVAESMFGYAVESEEEAIEMTVRNVPDYIPLLMEQCTE